MKKEEFQEYVMHRFCSDIRSIPFAGYAEKFEIIDDKTVSLVVPRDGRSEELVDALRYTKSGSARQLQNYTCTLYQKELEDLIRQHAADDFGTGIFVSLIWIITIRRLAYSLKQKIISYRKGRKDELWF